MERFRKLSSTHDVRFSRLYPSTVWRGSRRPAFVATMISLLRLFLELSDQALAAAIAIHVGGIDKIDAGINGLIQRARDSSSETFPHDPPIAQAPKLTSETFQWARPS